MQSGMVALALVAFRIGWGCWVVTMHALPNLFGARALFCNQYASLSMHPGHSPLGALSIIALLVSLLVQISTGLFANDDIFTEGPLALGSLMRRPASSQQFTRPIFGFLAGSSHCISARSVTTNSDEANALSSPCVSGRQPAEAGSPEADDTMGKRFFGLALFGVTSAGVYWLTTL